MTALAQLLALATAAGIDLHLTVLALGASTLLGWAPLPAELGYLGLPWILAVMASAYLLELALERHLRVGLGWHILQVPVRALGGALLVFLGLPATGPARVVAAGLGAAVALSVQLHLLGGRLLLHGAGVSKPPSPRVVSLAQDAVALGLVALALDLPLVGGGAAALLVVGLAVGCRGCLRAAPFGVRLLVGAARRALGSSGWAPENRLPGRASGAMESEVEVGEGGDLRGVRVGVADSGSPTRFRTGWLIRTRGRLYLVSAPTWKPEPVEARGSRVGNGAPSLWRTLALENPVGRNLLLPLNAPESDEILALFGTRETA